MERIPKWLAKLLSYISVFTCGGYAYATTHGNAPEFISSDFNSFFWLDVLLYFSTT